MRKLQAPHGLQPVGLGAVFCLLALALPVRAQRDAKVPDPDPEIERRALQVAEGFEVNLFAADPVLAKPIQMNFDATGRLWIASSEVYPQIAPGQKANDKIIVLEDTDGDGRADKTTVFADGLLIPTGVEPGDGGAYVGHSTELLHLTDTDGDGRADHRRIVLSGFGTEDTHHIVHTLRWGPDGMLYFNQSIYIHSHIETPYGVRRLGGGGVWQLRPESHQLEVFLRGFVNPWGHHFDRWGQSFMTDGANGEGITYGLPGAYYPTAPGATRLWHGMNPGSPKHCGLEILSGRHLPEEWRGNMVTNDFRGHRVCRFVLRDDGSGYISQEKSELIKSPHPAFRPIDVKMGPDGAIYVADWYNPIIQHGEVDFRDPRRDHTHGRIWRITAKGRPLVPRPRLTGAATADLLEALKAPEDWTRHQAKRLMKERGAKVLPDLAAWVGVLDKNDDDYEHRLLEALWTYQSLDTVEPKLLSKLLHAQEPRARAAAVRVLAQWQRRLPEAPALLAERIADDHPRVRLETIRALGNSSRPEALARALQALDRPMDPLLDYALWLTVRDLEPVWLPAVQSGQLTFAGRERHLTYALEAAASSAVVGKLVEMFQAGTIASDHEESVLTRIVSQGGPKELDLVCERVLALDDDHAAEQARLLAALERATKQHGSRPTCDPRRFNRLLNSKDEALRAAALRVAGQWRIQDAWPVLLDAATAATTSPSVRRAALNGLVSMDSPRARSHLIELCGRDHPVAVRQAAVIALIGVDLPEAAKHAVPLLAADAREDDIQNLFAAFLQQRKGPDVLAGALSGAKLPADVAKVALRQLGGGQDRRVLEEALKKAANLARVQRVLSATEMQTWVADVQKQGDAARGEAVFRRKELACFKCHAIGGAGGLVGPDLVSIGASAPIDYLIESLLQPNKAIKENYHSVVVSTIEGRTFTGIKVRESKDELVLRNGEDQEITIPVKDIEERAVGASLMPEGLVDGLTRPELLDLVRFLSELGKVGPYSVGPARIVRRWQVVEPTKAAYTLLSRTRLATVATAQADLPWVSAYSQVSGTLPPDSLPRFQWKGRAGSYSFARCQLDVSTGGQVQLRLNSATGLALWKDGAPVEVQQDLVLDLPSGAHTLTFQIDLDQRKAGLRCELDDVPHSPARVRIVSGK